jgi:DNA-binding NarL/FixJ family response regulator
MACNQEHDAMSLTISHPTPVHIVLPEILVAIGIKAALCSQTTLDVRIVACVGTGVPEVENGVIVTDYHRGLQFVRCARACPRPAAGLPVPVLVVSARDREHEIRFALEEGVHGYLPVSCPPTELADAVLALSRGLRYLSAVVAARMAGSFGRQALTLREHEVLALLACGECNKLISRRLDIAVGTVKSHVKSIMHKLDASSRAKAVSIATERGLVEVAGFAAVSERPDRQTHFA